MRPTSGNAPASGTLKRAADTKDVFTDEVLTTADDLAGLMVGTVQLPRARTDRALSDQLLAQGVETAVTLLDDRAATRT
jgi:hypothetical protein